MVTYTFLNKLGVYQHYLNEPVKDMKYQHKLLAMADFSILTAFWAYDRTHCMHALCEGSSQQQQTQMDVSCLRKIAQLETGGWSLSLWS